MFFSLIEHNNKFAWIKFYAETPETWIIHNKRLSTNIGWQDLDASGKRKSGGVKPTVPSQEVTPVEQGLRIHAA